MKSWTSTKTICELCPGLSQGGTWGQAGLDWRSAVDADASAHLNSEVKRKPSIRRAKSPTYPHILALEANYPNAGQVEGVEEMADVLNLPAKVVSFQDEANECLKLAQAEPQGGELKIILAGMAMGWLKLADFTRTSQALEIGRAEH
jgi:hypothetical protein